MKDVQFKSLAYRPQQTYSSTNILTKPEKHKKGPDKTVVTMPYLSLFMTVILSQTHNFHSMVIHEGYVTEKELEHTFL
jgi:hypothetical protein